MNTTYVKKQPVFVDEYMRKANKAYDEYVYRQNNAGLDPTELAVSSYHHLKGQAMLRQACKSSFAGAYYSKYFTINEADFEETISSGVEGYQDTDKFVVKNNSLLPDRGIWSTLSKVVMPLYEDLVGRRIFKRSQTIDPAARRWYGRVVEAEGVSDMSSDSAGTEAKNVDFKTTEVSGNLVKLAVGFTVSAAETAEYALANRNAGFSNLSPYAVKLKIATKEIRRMEDRFIFTGSTAVGATKLLSGFFDNFNSTNANTVAATNVTGSTGWYGNSSNPPNINTVITSDLRGNNRGASFLNDKGFFKPKILIIPPRMYNRLLASFQQISNSPVLKTIEETIMDNMKRDYSGFKIIPTNAVYAGTLGTDADAGYAPAGAGASYAILIDNSSENFQYICPRDVFMSRPIMNRDDSVSFRLNMIIGNIFARQPTAAYRFTNIGV